MISTSFVRCMDRLHLGDRSPGDAGLLAGRPSNSRISNDQLTGGARPLDDGGKDGLPLCSRLLWARVRTRPPVHFRPTRRAVAFVCAGTASGAPRSGAYSVQSMAADIASVADGLQLRRFVLVGHSMGGSAAIAHAGAHPGRVAGLVLVGTPGQSSPDQAEQIMGAMRADYDKVSEGYWKKLLSDAQPNTESQIRSEMKRIPRDASLEILNAIFAYDPLPALRAYPGAKLLVDTPHGDGPSSLHVQAPDIPRQVITRTSHWPQMDNPDEFNRILADFLANAS